VEVKQLLCCQCAGRLQFDAENLKHEKIGNPEYISNIRFVQKKILSFE
jgi:hypothetical protein